MTERFVQDEAEQRRDDALLESVPTPAELPLLSHYEAIENLYSEVDVKALIEQLIALQMLKQRTPELRERITEIENGTELASGAVGNLEQELQTIDDAIKTAQQRIEAANTELKQLRIQEAVLEDKIDELEGKQDDESIRARKKHRKDLEELRDQKELQRTVKRLQVIAIEEMEVRLAAVQSDVQVERTSQSRSLAYYKNKELLLRSRLGHVAAELGKIASAATTILESVAQLTELPELDEEATSDETPAYQLPGNGHDVWLESTPAIRSIPVRIEVPATPPESQLEPVEEPELESEEEEAVEDGLLPYRRIHQGLHHRRPSVATSGSRPALKIITNPSKK